MVLFLRAVSRAVVAVPRPNKYGRHRHGGRPNEPASVPPVRSRLTVEGMDPLAKYGLQRSRSAGEGGRATRFSEQFISESIAILQSIDANEVEALAVGLSAVRDRRGRLFILGVGGSAGHASHAVNDFRKICEFEAYAPTDNVSELTARINDEGWDSSFVRWLEGSRLSAADGILVFSVGGGNREHGVSVNLVRALELARERRASIFGVVGRDGGFTGQAADACVVIPPLYPDHITPHTEGLCAVVWHLLVSHPALRIAQTKWESMAQLPI